MLRPRTALALVLSSSLVAQAAAPATAPNTIQSGLQALLANGPRVAGTPSVRQAGEYLAAQYRALGYQTRFEPFEYTRTGDRGSSVRAGGVTVAASALDGSAGTQVSGALAFVEGTGTPEEFARANVRGKLAVVARGGLRFGEKATNAERTGATGLVIVNNAPGRLAGGTLGGKAGIPVVGVAQEDLPRLRALTGAVSVNANVVTETVAGRNLIAFKVGVQKPALVFGAHLDSVRGAPGANDNASGTLAVLDIARRAVNTPVGRSAWFLAFDGEEDGLRGSRAFVSQNAELVRGLKAMLNFDMVGVKVDPLRVGGTPDLVRRAQAAVPTLGRLPDSDDSDHASFLQGGAPALFFHTGLDANYHQPGDTVVDPTLVLNAAETGMRVAEAALQ